ncbi:MAG: hypothetical protein COA58_09615 [Bacteroidetes bacterium]|nr:MAG: hypothetical protein COA58_09615 [Bacteroidota bacterium]
MNLIAIKEPCQENWDKMTPNEQGRHCQGCVKTVHDVSHLSNDQVWNKYHELEGNMCIRIPAERAFIAPKPWYTRWKYAITASILTFWLSAQQVILQAQTTETDTTNDTIEKTIEQCIVSGKVLDSLNNGNPIPFAFIEITLPDFTKYRSYSNTLGEFSIKVEHKLKTSDTISVTCTMLGYEKIERKSLARDTIEAEFFLEENHVCLNETIIMARRNKVTIMGGISGQVMMGIPMDDSKYRGVYRHHILDQFDTKTFHSDEIQRSNLGR